MLQQHLRNISNTKNSVSLGYPNTEKRGNKYKRSLVKSFKKTMSFRQTELLSSTDKNVRIIKAKEILKERKIRIN